MVIKEGITLNLNEVLEAGRVMRYHAAPIDKKQSVAEHSWGVAVCILKLWPDTGKDLLLHAILHDIAEVYTGDVPAPVKKASSAVKNMFDSLEEDALEMMEVDLPVLNSVEQRRLKIADCLEGMKYCERRIQAGDLAAVPVRDRYVVYLNKLGFDPKEMTDVGE
mgnify:CR=1 FL=1